MERSDMERSDMERSDMERSDMERSDTETTDTTYASVLCNNGKLNESEKRYIFFAIMSLVISIPLIRVYPDIMADIFGWAALSLFVLSRIPQILLNYTRKTTHGLSMSSFVLINISNYVSLASILVDVYTYDDVLANIQWIISPFMTTILDVIIIYQSKMYVAEGEDVTDDIFGDVGEYVEKDVEEHVLIDI
jgi:uncharacterized protein with PQ loop repeat